jgi:hypothetical protein
MSNWRSGRRRLAVMIIAAAALSLAGGIAYATTRADSSVFTACVHETTGDMRMIDPSLGTSSIRGHCQPNETLVSWNGQGAPGPAGEPGAAGAPGPAGKDGAPGADGKDGISVTSETLGAGDPNCPEGGSAFTSASGTTYACNGADGAKGEKGDKGDPGQNGAGFNGVYTSPNGLYSISITNDSAEITGPGSSVKLLQGFVYLNGPTCRPAARMGEPVFGNEIITGSPTVCVGG